MFSHAVIKKMPLLKRGSDVHISMKLHQLFCLLSSYIGMENKIVSHCYSCTDFKLNSTLWYDSALNVGEV